MLFLELFVRRTPLVLQTNKQTNKKTICGGNNVRWIVSLGFTICSVTQSTQLTLSGVFRGYKMGTWPEIG